MTVQEVAEMITYLDSECNRIAGRDANNIPLPLKASNPEYGLYRFCQRYRNHLFKHLNSTSGRAKPYTYEVYLKKYRAGIRYFKFMHIQYHVKDKRDRTFLTEEEKDILSQIEVLYGKLYDAENFNNNTVKLINKYDRSKQNGR